jgi:hypothetical protein
MNPLEKSYRDQFNNIARQSLRNDRWKIVDRAMALLESFWANNREKPLQLPSIEVEEK